MPVDNAKRAALIAEGMSEPEADFMLSGGTTELTPPADSGAGDAGAGAPAEPAAPAGGAAAAQADPAAAAPAAPAAPAGDDDDDPRLASDPKAVIPYQKYARDKQKLREQLRERDDRLNTTSTQLNQLQERWQRLDERFKVFSEAATAAAAAQADPNAGQPKPKPDRETDPFGYMAWLEERIESLAPKVDKVETQAQEQQAYETLRTTFRTDADTFRRTTPDFAGPEGAYAFLLKSRDAELQAAGYGEEERARIIALDERDIVARALHARQQNPAAPGPAQVLYNLAAARGYRKPAGAPTNGAATNGAPAPATNGAAAPAAPAAPSVTQQVEQIQRGQAASRSLSSAGGAPVNQGIDLAKLAEMNDGEYLEFMRSLSPAQRREYHAMIGAPAR